VDAWEAYLHGRFHWNQRSAAGLRFSVDHLQRAVSLDPAFALAYAGLADAYITQTIYGLARPDHAMPRALEATTRALQLDPSSAEALTARGSVRALYSYARADAERDFLAALTLREQYATTHQWYAMHLLAPQSRFADARARLARARALDPLSPAIAASSGILRFFERDYEQAVAEYRAVLAQHPGFDFAEYLLGQAYTAMGRYDDAVLVLRHAAHASHRSTEVVSALACAEALSGNLAVAGELLRELQLRAESTFVSPALLAQVHVALNEPERALDTLDEALTMRAMEMPLLGVRPAFDALREAPRFIRIVHEATGRTSGLQP
jgi:serine/threonine-protein kinase